jgi:hypothetical protein
MEKKAFTYLSENIRLATIGGKFFQKLNVSDMGYEIGFLRSSNLNILWGGFHLQATRNPLK